jgi:hypothetical protein
MGLSDELLNELLAGARVNELHEGAAPEGAPPRGNGSIGTLA